MVRPKKPEGQKVRGDGKESTSFRLSDTARALLKQLAGELGVSQSAVLEILIRERAKNIMATL